jgi:hypothetical protein
VVLSNLIEWLPSFFFSARNCTKKSRISVLEAGSVGAISVARPASVRVDKGTHAKKKQLDRMPDA